MSAIERVIEAAGGVTALAAQLGVKPPTVSQWRSGDRPVPPRHAIAVAAKWPDAASTHDLRPDVFGPAPSDQQEAA